jgi:hypothetical protein
MKLMFLVPALFLMLFEACGPSFECGSSGGFVMAVPDGGLLPDGGITRDTCIAICGNYSYMCTTDGGSQVLCSQFIGC